MAEDERSDELIEAFAALAGQLSMSPVEEFRVAVDVVMAMTYQVYESAVESGLPPSLAEKVTHVFFMKNATASR